MEKKEQERRNEKTHSKNNLNTYDYKKPEWKYAMHMKFIYVKWEEVQKIAKYTIHPLYSIHILLTAPRFAIGNEKKSTHLDSKFWKW